MPPTLPPMNKEQREAYEDLLSTVDDLELALDPYTGEIIFEGYNSDGPVCGYIEESGTVSWC